MEDKDLHIDGLDKKKPMFQAPAGYFEMLEGELIQELSTPVKKKYPLQMIWYSLAAAAMLVFVIFIMYPEKSDPKNEIVQLNDTAQYIQFVLLDENSEWALDEEEAVQQLVMLQEENESEAIVDWMMDQELTEDDILHEI
jgi:hypothetical protein